MLSSQRRCFTPMPFPIMRDDDRRLLLELYDGEPRVLALLYSLTQFKRKDEVLKYLYKRGIRGLCLWVFFKEHDESALRVYETVIGVVDGLMKRPALLQDLT